MKESREWQHATVVEGTLLRYQSACLCGKTLKVLYIAASPSACLYAISFSTLA